MFARVLCVFGGVVPGPYRASYAEGRSKGQGARNNSIRFQRKDAKTQRRKAEGIVVSGCCRSLFGDLVARCRIVSAALRLCVFALNSSSPPLVFWAVPGSYRRAKPMFAGVLCVLGGAVPGSYRGRTGNAVVNDNYSSPATTIKIPLLTSLLCGVGMRNTREKIFLGFHRLT